MPYDPYICQYLSYVVYVFVLSTLRSVRFASYALRFLRLSMPFLHCLRFCTIYLTVNTFSILCITIPTYLLSRVPVPTCRSLGYQILHTFMSLARHFVCKGIAIRNYRFFGFIISLLFGSFLTILTSFFAANKDL